MSFSGEYEDFVVQLKQNKNTKNTKKKKTTTEKHPLHKYM